MGLVGLLSLTIARSPESCVLSPEGLGSSPKGRMTRCHRKIRAIKLDDGRYSLQHLLSATARFAYEAQLLERAISRNV